MANGDNKLELYENGKHRRYTLLFAVNGGAFAIAKLMNVIKPDGNVQIINLGNLSLKELSLGMVIFTLIMVADIFAFGLYSKGNDSFQENLRNWRKRPFGIMGIFVLFSICILICAGWLRVGC